MLIVAFIVLSPVAALTQPEIGDDTPDTVPDGFVLIEAGTFTMGSPPDEPSRSLDETQHEVTIARNFYLQVHEVTQGQWRLLMGNNPAFFSSCGDGCPVEMVNWYEAIAYANELSQGEGLDECYVLSLCLGQPGEGMECTEVSFEGLDCQGYRLPTEAEWEYATRAGTTTAFHSGPILENGCWMDRNLDEIGWYCGNSGGASDPVVGPTPIGGHSEPVGQKEENNWGLFDVSGNVWEWVWDWYGSDYYSSPPPSQDPLGPPSGPDRVLRGGSWSDFACFARAAARNRNDPGYRFSTVGFRLGRTAP